MAEHKMRAEVSSTKTRSTYCRKKEKKEKEPKRREAQYLMKKK